MQVRPDQVFMMSELKSYGYTEDGEEFIGEVFYVIVESDRGDRWTHNRWYDGVEVSSSEYGTCFQDTREWAHLRCESLIDAITTVGWVDLDNWSESRPAYGSQAYLDYGQADDLAWENAQEA